jgi:hypothetical protein
VTILPFTESLTAGLAAMEVDQRSQILQGTLRGYFSHHSKLSLEPGFRFSINSIEFIVASCHPPVGLVQQSTKISVTRAVKELQGEQGQRPQAGIQDVFHRDRVIERIHILPTRASLEERKDTESGESFLPLSFPPRPFFSCFFDKSLFLGCR